MLIKIMAATVAADPAVALESRDDLVLVGLWPRHEAPFLAQRYAHFATDQSSNTQTNAQFSW
jgi:hypothetical protein